MTILIEVFIAVKHCVLGFNYIFFITHFHMFPKCVVRIPHQWYNVFMEAYMCFIGLTIQILFVTFIKKLVNKKKIIFRWMIFT